MGRLRCLKALVLCHYLDFYLCFLHVSCMLVVGFGPEEWASCRGAGLSAFADDRDALHT